MKKYNLLNNILGWVSFIIAAIVYLLTIEPTVSLWDCGEFIASAFKLQIGHPPGAPLFMIIARFFSLFASDVSKVAMMVNAMSGLASAFTILFLFWTITHLAKKIVIKDNNPSINQIIAVLGCAFVGAMAYTFSDTFWFSAVEGEVYASSSLFTAVVFWAILKWENVAHQKFSNRWIILIAYLVGLSIGVHLLNLLAIPAIVFVYYFKTYTPTRKGVIYALIVSLILLGTAMYGIIPGIIKMSSKFELFFVNTVSLPPYSGVIIHVVALLVMLGYGIYLTHYSPGNKKLTSLVFTLSFFLMGIPMILDNFFLALLIAGLIYIIIYYLANNHEVVLNAILISFAVIFIGYSSFSMIVIRSLANPPMDENNPETVFSLLSYLNREQYGDRPLFYGQYYNAPIIDFEKTSPVYTLIDGKYEITDYKNKYVYDKAFTTFFPRMWSSDNNHIDVYKQYGRIKGRPVKGKDGKTLNKPTFSENIRFFISYQINHMYWRYFLWNFVGRQSDNQADGGIVDGNWISGIKFIDEWHLGKQDKLPEEFKSHPARNKYYALPLLLGLLGLWFHYKKNKTDFWVVTLLFALTGLAIVIYLNQNPLQPRERDYAYAGSFYAFAIWIGLGVLALIELLGKYGKNAASTSLIVLLSLALVPSIMALENWDDHDRSGRYSTLAVASNYLNSCTPNAILFTNGDNDTFPLWYAQEVEGIRTDIRVVNLMLFNTDWYIDQMKRKAYEADPIPSSLTKEKYLQGKRDVIYIQERIKEAVDIKDIIQFVASDNDGTKLMTSGGDKIDYIPAKKLKLSVNPQKVIEHGIVKPEDAALIDTSIEWTLNRGRITKSDLMVMDILANNNWERPIYYIALGHSGTLGLDDYMQLEGFAYKLVPIKTKSGNSLDKGRIDTDIMYRNMMEKFDYGRMNADDVYLDHYHRRTLNVLRFRNQFLRLARELFQENKKDSAVAVLDKCLELTPNNKVPFDYFTIGIAELYLKMGEKEKGEALLREYEKSSSEKIQYFLSVGKNYISGADEDLKRELQIFQQLDQLTRTYELEELNKEISIKFKDYYGQFVQLMSQVEG